MSQQSYDVIVLGVGAMGSAALYQAAKRGVSVLGIDRYHPPHSSGSSHGESRITRQAVGEGRDYVPLVLRSHEIWRDIEAITQDRLLEVTGGLIIAGQGTAARNHVADFFARTVDSAVAFNIPHRIMDATQIRATFPQFKVRDGDTAYFEDGAGFVRPEACIAAQIRLARDHGADLRTGETVLRYGADVHGVTVTTDRETYHGGTLIMSAGAWMPTLLGDGASEVLKIHRQVLHWFDVTDYADAFQPGRFPIFIWEPQGKSKVIYGFPEASPGGGIKVATETYETTCDPDHVDRRVSQAEIDDIYDDLVAPLFHGVSRRSLRTETCLYTVTPDSGFVIDRHPRHANVIIASPCSGHGFKHSAAIGQILAELAIDGNSRFDLSAFRLDRLGPNPHA